MSIRYSASCFTRRIDFVDYPLNNMPKDIDKRKYLLNSELAHKNLET